MGRNGLMLGLRDYIELFLNRRWVDNGVDIIIGVVRLGPESKQDLEEPNGRNSDWQKSNQRVCPRVAELAPGQAASETLVHLYTLLHSNIW